MLIYVWSNFDWLRVASMVPGPHFESDFLSLLLNAAYISYCGSHTLGHLQLVTEFLLKLMQSLLEVNVKLT